MTGIEFNAQIVSYVLIALSAATASAVVYNSKSKRAAADGDPETIRKMERELEARAEIARKLMATLSEENREFYLESGKETFMRMLQKKAERSDCGQRSPYEDAVPVSDDRTDAEPRECDKADFHFSALGLLKACFSEDGNSIYNPSFGNRQPLIGRQDFFVNFQTFLNGLVKSGTYDIDDSALRRIKRAVWTGDPSSVIREIDLANRFDKNSAKYETDGITGERIFGKILVVVLNHECYRDYWKEMKGKIDAKHQAYRNLNAKRRLIRDWSQETLSSEEEELAKELAKELGIIREIESVVGKRLVEFLELDASENSLRLKIRPSDVFSKKILKLIEFYKASKRLEKIQFYI